MNANTRKPRRRDPDGYCYYCGSGSCEDDCEEGGIQVKPSNLERAKAYVEAQDYLFDENREIAGKAFMAGYEAALEDAVAAIEGPTKLIAIYDETGEKQPLVDVLEDVVQLIRKLKHRK